jgi:hypothetical protein
MSMSHYWRRGFRRWASAISRSSPGRVSFLSLMPMSRYSRRPATTLGVLVKFPRLHGGVLAVVCRAYPCVDCDLHRSSTCSIVRISDTGCSGFTDRTCALIPATVPPFTLSSLTFYFGDICYSEFCRKRGLFSDLGFGLKRAVIASGGHPRRRENSAWTSRPGSPRTGWRVVKRTLLLASKFTETPSSRAARLQRDRGSHEIGVYRLLARRLEPSFDDGLETSPSILPTQRSWTGRMKMWKQDEVARTRARKSAMPQKRHEMGF